MTQAPPPPGPPQPYSPTSYNQQPQQPQKPQKVKPSAIWYLIALLCVIGGGVFAIQRGVNTFETLQTFIEGFDHISIPGETTYMAPEAGKYAIYFVGPEAAQTRRQVEAETPFTVTAVDADTGESIELRDLESENVEINEESFRAWKGFTVDGRTSVKIVVTPTDPASVEPVPAAIGPETGMAEILGMMKDIFVLMAAVGGGALLGLIIFLVTLIRRSSCKSRIRRQQQGYA